MAGVKRKATFDTKPQATSTLKKLKNDEKRTKPPTPVQPFETETDSEPIVESDTTSQSGDDDGASWPSGEQVEEDDELGGISEEENEDGGTGIATDTADTAQSEIKPASTNGNITSTTRPISRHASPLN